MTDTASAGLYNLDSKARRKRAIIGSLMVLAALAATGVLAASGFSRWWRILAALPYFYGFAQLFQAYEGL